MCELEGLGIGYGLVGCSGGPGGRHVDCGLGGRPFEIVKNLVVQAVFYNFSFENCKNTLKLQWFLQQSL